MWKKITSVISGALALPLLAFAPMVGATTPVTVNSANTMGWSTGDTRPGGSVTFVDDLSATLGTGALRLTTDATSAAKAQYMHEAGGVALNGVTNLEYQTKQVSGPTHASAAYQLVVDLNGNEVSGGFTTLVYEPYQNGTVMAGSWQTWDVAAGKFWSSRTFSDGASCNVTSGAGGAPFYTLAELRANCTDAVVNGYGVNVGTFNPSYDIQVDGVVFNETTYDFEWAIKVANKEACKNDGWKASNSPVYKNQGDCVSAFASLEKSEGNAVTRLFRNLF